MGIRPQTLENCSKLLKLGTPNRRYYRGLAVEIAQICSALEQDHDGYPASSVQNLFKMSTPNRRYYRGLAVDFEQICSALKQDHNGYPASSVRNLLKMSTPNRRYYRGLAVEFAQICAPQIADTIGDWQSNLLKFARPWSKITMGIRPPAFENWGAQRGRCSRVLSSSRE